MKKFTQSALLLLFFTLCFATANAQTGGGWGIKGGLNYNSNGKYFKDAQATFGDPLNNVGFNLGLFSNVSLGPLYLRPEVSYTQLNGEVNAVKVRTERIDVPVLVGINVFKLVSVFAGPSFHYTIQDEFRSFDYERINAGYQFGLGLNLGRVGVDLRYERELNNRNFKIDNVFPGDGNFRYQQLILALSLRL